MIVPLLPAELWQLRAAAVGTRMLYISGQGTMMAVVAYTIWLGIDAASQTNEDHANSCKFAVPWNLSNWRFP